MKEQMSLFVADGLLQPRQPPQTAEPVPSVEFYPAPGHSNSILEQNCHQRGKVLMFEGPQLGLQGRPGPQIGEMFFALPQLQFMSDRNNQGSGLILEVVFDFIMLLFLADIEADPIAHQRREGYLEIFSIFATLKEVQLIRKERTIFFLQLLLPFDEGKRRKKRLVAVVFEEVTYEVESALPLGQNLGRLRRNLLLGLRLSHAHRLVAAVHQYISIKYMVGPSNTESKCFRPITSSKMTLTNHFAIFLRDDGKQVGNDISLDHIPWLIMSLLCLLSIIQKMASKQQLWTNDFWTRLRSQLTQRVRPSRSVLQALKHVTQLNQKYKQEQQICKLKIKELESQVIQLRRGGKTEKKKMQIENKVLSHQVRPQEKQSEEQKGDNEVELTLLNGRIQHLEELLQAKEVRCTQMAHKEAVLTGQIDLLSLRSQSLQQRIAILEGMVSSQHQQNSLKELDSPQETENLAESQDIEDLASSSTGPVQITISEAPRSSKAPPSRFSKQSNISLAAVAELEEDGLGLYINREGNSSMMMSCTHVIEIEEEYDIEKRATLKQAAVQFEEDESLNEIDNILEAQGDKPSSHWLSGEQFETKNLNVNTSAVAVCMNNSVVDIQLNQEPFSFI